MLEYCKGNLLEAKVEALVNPVNCVGVMGKGLALAFKQAYPDNFYYYKIACSLGEVKVGQMFITANNSFLYPFYIINFPTKEHWKDPSKIEYVKDGLVALTKDIHRLQIKSIAIPALGCGLGGLEWKEVESLIISAFNPLPKVNVKLYPPQL